MTNKFLILVLTVFPLFFNAQLGIINKEIADEIVKKETVVVLSDTDTIYNELLKEAITKYWKITKYSFKKAGQLENKYKNNTTNYIELKFVQQAKGELYGFGWSLAFEMGGPKGVGVYNARKMINDLVYFKTNLEQISLAVQVIQNHIKEGLYNGAKINRYPATREYYTKENVILNKGNILILKRDLIEPGYNNIIKREVVTEKDKDIVINEMLSIINKETNKEIVVIDKEFFGIEKQNCKYYLERQPLEFGVTLFVLYEIDSYRIVTIFETRSNRYPHHTSEWKKIAKTVLQ